MRSTITERFFGSIRAMARAVFTLIVSMTLTFTVLHTSALAHAPPTPPLDGPVLTAEGFQVIAAHVRAFEEHLTQTQRKTLNHVFDHPKRDRGFCYVLAHCKQDHSGLKMSELRGTARFQLHQLLTRVMSAQGYLKFLKIMARERLLEEMEDANRRYPKIFTATAGETGVAWRTPLKRNYDDYYIAFFGHLKQGEKWGLRLEGHHYSLSLTIDARTNPMTISSTPLFMGVSPMVVPAPPKETPELYPRWYDSEGHHLMATESQLSKAIVAAMTSVEREKSQWPTWPGPTLSGSIDQVPPQQVAKVTDPTSPGFSIAQGSESVQELLVSLFNEYLGVQRVTGIDREKLVREFRQSGKIYWKGDFLKPMEKFYLRIESERYLFELLQNDLWSVDSEHTANHIHSSLRDLKADWDHDRLGEHLTRFHNHKNSGAWETMPAKISDGQSVEQVSGQNASEIKEDSVSKGAKGTVIIAHGSGGKNQSTARWGEFITKLGFDAVIIDSFTPRQYKHRQDVGWDVAVTHQSSDLADVLKQLDPEKRQQPVFLMGFSMGGYSVLKLFSENKSFFQDNAVVDGSILFYPRCHDFVGSQLTQNMLFVMGDQDARAPYQDCERMVQMSPYKASQEVAVLAGATHGFDVLEFSEPQTMTEANGEKHVMEYNAESLEKAQKKVKVFLEQVISEKIY